MPRPGRVGHIGRADPQPRRARGVEQLERVSHETQACDSGVEVDEVLDARRRRLARHFDEVLESVGANAQQDGPLESGAEEVAKRGGLGKDTIGAGWDSGNGGGAGETNARANARSAVYQPNGLVGSGRRRERRCALRGVRSG